MLLPCPSVQSGPFPRNERQPALSQGFLSCITMSMYRTSLMDLRFYYGYLCLVTIHVECSTALVLVFYVTHVKKAMEPEGTGEQSPHLCPRRTMWPGGQGMGKSRNFLSHSSVLHNEGTPTLSRCLWDGHAPSYNCHTDTMTAGKIRTLAKIQKGTLMVFVCDYKTNWQ
jgi:hypothetical protein